MATDNKISYLNTLIFTIVTGIISLIVLGCLFFEFGQRFIYFIIGFEIGVFFLIGYCIYKIVRAEKRYVSGDDKYVVRFNECPDYYAKRVYDGKEYCVNDYVVKDNAGGVYIVKVTPASTDPPTSITVTDNATPYSGQPYSKFELHALEADNALKTYDEKCKPLFVNPTDAKYQGYPDVSQIPWTYVRSRCESFAR